MLRPSNRRIDIRDVQMPPGTIGLAEAQPEDMAISVARARLALARSRTGSRQLPGVRVALASIEDALIAIDAIRAALDEMAELVRDASASEDEARRALLADRYDDLRSAINEASGAMSKDTSVLTSHGRARLEVSLDRTGRTKHVVRGADLSAGTHGLDLPPPLEAFGTADELASVASAIEAGYARLERAGSVLLDDAGALTAAVSMV